METENITEKRRTDNPSKIEDYDYTKISGKVLQKKKKKSSWTKSKQKNEQTTSAAKSVPKYNIITYGLYNLEKVLHKNLGLDRKEQGIQTNLSTLQFQSE